MPKQNERYYSKFDKVKKWLKKGAPKHVRQMVVKFGKGKGTVKSIELHEQGK
jgi:hypothetical protein